MGGESGTHATELRFVHTFCRTLSRIARLENLDVGETIILKFMVKEVRCYLGLIHIAQVRMLCWVVIKKV
jgi:hypothetical protein